MKKLNDKLNLIFKHFPSDAKTWKDATEEIRELAKIARETISEFDNIEIKPLNFRSFKTPSEWNTESKKFIKDVISKMSDKTKEQYYNEIKDRFTFNENKNKNKNKNKNMKTTKLYTSINEFKQSLIKENTDIQSIINNIDPVAVKHDDNLNVLVKDKNSEFSAWVEVYINNSNDVVAEWNQYIFSTTNSKDIFQKQIQDNLNVFEEFTSCAINYLESLNIIYQDDNGKWFLNKQNENYGYATHDGSFGGDDSEEDLYHEIDWKDVENKLDNWFKLQQKVKLDYDTLIKTFGKMKELIEKYKMLN